MSIEPIGLLIIVVGILCLLLGYRATAVAFAIATLLQSAAALLLGNANIQPAHLMLTFLAMAVFTNSRRSSDAIAALNYPEPGFWLICLVVYGVFSAFAFPRLFEGTTAIVPLTLSGYFYIGSTVPLGPVSSNLTQSIYLVGDLACFILIVGIASSHEGFRSITNAIIACAVANLFLALLDIATFSTGTQLLLDFIRNAQYGMLVEGEISGLKRIVGSFPEASAFARSALGLLAFTGTLSIYGIRPKLNALLACATLVLVVLSTSSTGIAGTPLVAGLLYLTFMLRHGFHKERPALSITVVCVPLIVLIATLAVLLNDGASQTVRNYLDTLIFNKSKSASAIERSSWNSFAIRNFFDSYGLGVGLGTPRTSSLPVALLSNVGVPGTLLYLLFAVSALFRRRGAPSFESDVRLAARNGCLGLMCGDFLASPTVEQGLLFFALAALACSVPEREVVRSRAISPVFYSRPVGTNS